MSYLVVQMHNIQAAKKNFQGGQELDQETG
jgi:hypothetical protein